MKNLFILKVNNIQILKRILLYVLFLFSFFASHAQEVYLPVSDYSLTKEVHAKYKKKFYLTGFQAKLSNTKASMQFTKMLNDQWSSIYVRDTLGYFLYSDSLTLRTKKIFDKIIAANTELQGKEYLFLIYKDEFLNAVSMGEGIIALNMGLFSYIKNEDEIAFILAHELAHEYKNHVIGGMKAYCEAYNSKEFKSQVKDIKKMRYNKRDQILALQASMNSEFLEHSRSNELVADSLAAKFIENAGYSKWSAISTLKILDKLDEMYYKDTLDFKKYLDFKEYPFKSKWLVTESKSDFWNYLKKEKEPLPDSLKTHPDCKIRIEKIVKENKIDSTGLNSFSLNKTNISFEIVNLLLEQGSYVEAFYHALKLKDEYPNEKFLDCAVAECLFHFAWAIKNKQFTSIVGFPNEDYPAGINQMYIFLNNCNSSTFLSFLAQYYKSNLDKTQSDFVNYIGILNKFYNESDEMNLLKIKEFSTKTKNKSLNKRLNKYKPIKPKKK